MEEREEEESPALTVVFPLDKSRTSSTSWNITHFPKRSRNVRNSISNASKIPGKHGMPKKATELLKKRSTTLLNTLVGVRIPNIRSGHEKKMKVGRLQPIPIP